MLSVPLARVQTVSAQGVAPNQPMTLSQTLPPLPLRGYGTLSATSRALAEGASVLQISCETPEKAQLVLAKYLSDTMSLPGVKEDKIGATSVRLVSGGGAAAAVRDGKNVLLFAAPSRAALGAALQSELVGKAGLVSAPEVAVPMWLDRWDKYNFRFYYREWETPPDQNVETYDFVGDFDYAKAQGDAGFVFWNTLMQNDSAVGMTNLNWWNYAYDEAKKRELPIGINSEATAPTWLLNRYRDETENKMPGFSGNYHKLVSPDVGGQGRMSWNSQAGQDAMLGVLQASLRKFAANPSTISFLEPHGEIHHGAQDIFLEYGPVADANYRRYLQEKYRDVGAVNARWGTNLKNWDEVRVPEVASFFGWNAGAIDVGGAWRIGYEPLTDAGAALAAKSPSDQKVIESQGAPAAWFALDFDDSNWPEVRAPGHDQQLYQPQLPAVMRRDYRRARRLEKSPSARLALCLGLEPRPRRRGAGLGQRQTGRTQRDRDAGDSLGRHRSERFAPAGAQSDFAARAARLHRLPRLSFARLAGTIPELGRNQKRAVGGFFGFHPMVAGADGAARHGDDSPD